MRSKKVSSNATSSRTAGQSEGKKMPQRWARGAFSGPHNIRSMPLAGLLVLAIFYTIYFMRASTIPARPRPAAELPAPTNCVQPSTPANSPGGECWDCSRVAHPYIHLCRFSPGSFGVGLGGGRAGEFAADSAQVVAFEKAH